MPPRSKKGVKLSLTDFHAIWKPKGYQHPSWGNMTDVYETPLVENDIQEIQEIPNVCNTIDSNIENNTDNISIITSSLEPEIKLPEMNREIFAANFKVPMQQFIHQIRVFHRKQAKILEDNWIKPDKKSYDTALIERIEYVRLCFYEIYEFEKKMIGFDNQPMIDLYMFIINERISTTKSSDRFHSQPKSIQRFCRYGDEIGYGCQQCPLRKYFDWCDLKHVEDVKEGDIVWTTINDKYDDDLPLKALIIVYNKNSCDEMSIIQLCQLTNDFYKDIVYTLKFDFFKNQKFALKNLDISQEYYRCNYQTDFYEMRKSHSKFICSLSQLSAFYKINLECYQLQLLAALGLHHKNLLNHLLSGLLSFDIIQSLQYIENNTEIGMENNVTPDLINEWLIQHGPKRTWQFIKELIVQQKHHDHLMSNYSYPQPIIVFDYNLEQLQKAIQCFDYITGTDRFSHVEKPNNIPDHLILTKNSKLYEYWDYSSQYNIYEVLIWCLQYGGNTALIDTHETLVSWKEKNKVLHTCN